MSRKGCHVTTLRVQAERQGHSMLGLSGGGAGRADELRRTRLYREASNMYYTQASFFLGIALAAALFATPTAAIEFVGKVVGVTDGDTLGSVSIALAAVLAVGHAEPVSAKGLNRQQVRALNGSNIACGSPASTRPRGGKRSGKYRSSTSRIWHTTRRSRSFSTSGTGTSAIRSNRAWPGITRSTRASNPLRTGWPTRVPRRRLGQGGGLWRDPRPVPPWEFRRH
jgi:hypothetical protein